MSRSDLQPRKRKLIYLALGALILSGVPVFIAYYLLNTNLFEVGTFSGLQTSSDVQQNIASQVKIGETTLSEAEAIMNGAGIRCSLVDSSLVCWTAAPNQYPSTSSFTRDFMNYLFIDYVYRIEFQFRESVLANVMVTVTAIGF